MAQPHDNDAAPSNRRMRARTEKRRIVGDPDQPLRTAADAHRGAR